VSLSASSPSRIERWTLGIERFSAAGFVMSSEVEISLNISRSASRLSSLDHDYEHEQAKE
jgi:hypothetical protein